MYFFLYFYITRVPRPKGPKFCCSPGFLLGWLNELEMWEPTLILCHWFPQARILPCRTSWLRSHRYLSSTINRFDRALVPIMNWDLSLQWLGLSVGFLASQDTSPQLSHLEHIRDIQSILRYGEGKEGKLVDIRHQDPYGGIRDIGYASDRWAYKLGEGTSEDGEKGYRRFVTRTVVDACECTQQWFRLKRAWMQSLHPVVVVSSC